MVTNDTSGHFEFHREQDSRLLMMPSAKIGRLQSSHSLVTS